MEKHEEEKMDRAPPAGLDFHRVFAKAPTPLMVMDRDLCIVYANESYLAATMRRLSDIQGRYVFDAFPESEARVARFLAAFKQALAGEQNVLTTEPFSVPVPGEGLKEIVWTCSHTPIVDDAGEVAFVLQHAVDVTAKYQLDRDNEVLVYELDHRVKNSLAIVQALARQSMVDTKPMAEARDDFLARLHAMAGLHNVLLAENLGGARLEAVLAQALGAFGHRADAQGRIELCGPSAPLTAKQAQTLAMAFHELATNASKYGALSNEAGAVRISWTYDPAADGAFALVWQERDGPPVDPPARQGFGTMMLTRILAEEISGTIALEYPSQGVVCRIEGRLETDAK